MAFVILKTIERVSECYVVEQKCPRNRERAPILWADIGFFFQNLGHILGDFGANRKPQKTMCKNKKALDLQGLFMVLSGL